MVAPGKGKDIDQSGFPDAALLFQRVTEAIRNPEKMTPAMKKRFLNARSMLPDEKTLEALYHPKIPVLGPKLNHVHRNRVSGQSLGSSLRDRHARLAKYFHLRPLPSEAELMPPLRKMMHEKLKSRMKEMALPKSKFEGDVYINNHTGIQAAAADLMKANVASEDVIAPTKEKQLATWGTEIPDDLLFGPSKTC